MPRLLFEKKGNAIWISHLDLMRVFQRSFKRAGLPLTHTQGFNPRPSVSIALPLSVGIESSCELLDFDLDGEPIPEEEIKRRLNEKLVEGGRVLDVYGYPGSVTDTRRAGLAMGGELSAAKARLKLMIVLSEKPELAKDRDALEALFDI